MQPADCPACRTLGLGPRLAAVWLAAGALSEGAETVITTDLDAIFSEYPDAGRSALIPILQDVQRAHGYLSRDAVARIGRYLKLPSSKIYGVATFYNQFRFQPQGRFHIQVCRGTACHVRGSAAVLDALCRELKVAPGQTTRDGLFSLEVVACIGACGLAPVICVNDKFHANLTSKKIPRLLDDYRKQAENHDTSKTA
jgi:NADH-quinone oxidoreductase subunit E